MRRRFNWDKKYLYWGMTAFGVIACAILFYMILSYLPALGKALGKLVKILSPFIWGLVITYLLLPLMRLMERNVFGPLMKKAYRKNKKDDGHKMARGLSILVSEIVMLAIITALVYLILPQLYSSIEHMVQNSNGYAATVEVWINNLLRDYPEIMEYANTVLDEVSGELRSWVQNTVLPGLGSMISNLTTGVYYVVMGIYNLIIGIIVSVYILGNVESFTAGCRRLLYSLFSVETAEKIREGVAFTDRTFMGFINGKLLDSAIIGLICYIVCAILNMPYALLVSVIVGVTNVVPFFGPFIGAVPSVIIILMVSPVKALIFVIFIIVLQQVDGNIIGPKILGDSTGLSAFWVLFALLLFNHIMGFWGMLLGVPLFASFYYLFREFINSRLKKKDLPVASEDYVDIVGISPTGVVTYADPQRIQFPALIWGENSLLSRLRRKKAGAGEAPPSEEPTDPPAE